MLYNLSEGDGMHTIKLFLARYICKNGKKCIYRNILYRDKMRGKLKICTTCGEENLYENNFCSKCGSSLSFTTTYGLDALLVKPDEHPSKKDESKIIRVYATTATGSTITSVYRDEIKEKSLSDLINETGLRGDFFLKAYRDGILDLEKVDNNGIPVFRLSEEGEKLKEKVKKDKKQKIE